MGTEIFQIDASWAEKLTKARVQFLLMPTVLYVLPSLSIGSGGRLAWLRGAQSHGRGLLSSVGLLILAQECQCSIQNANGISLNLGIFSLFLLSKVVNFQVALNHSILKVKSIVIPLNQMSQSGEKHAQDYKLMWCILMALRVIYFLAVIYGDPVATIITKNNFSSKGSCNNTHLRFLTIMFFPFCFKIFCSIL